MATAVAALVLVSCNGGTLSEKGGDGSGDDDSGVRLMPRDGGGGGGGDDAGGGGGDAGGGGGDAGGGGGDDAGGGGGFDAGPGGGGDGCADGPLDAPIPGCSPTPVPSSGDPYQDCVDRINQFRWECQCLPPLERWEEGEGCADMQAEYDSTRGAHAGFRAGICSPSGRAQNECPGWGSTAQVIGGCLQAMWDEGPGEPFEEHGHYINMSNTGHSRVACGFYTTDSGAVWAVQNFQ